MEPTFKYPHERQTKSLDVRIPAWISSIEDIASKHSLEADRFRVLLHQFFLCYLKNSKFRRSKAGKNFLPDFFPVSSVLLRQTCTDNYVKYINTLIAEGIIEKRMNENGTPSYLSGGHAQLYRWLIPNTFNGGCSFRKESITGWKQIKSVLRTRDQYAKACSDAAIKFSKSNSVYTEILSYLNDVVLAKDSLEESGSFHVTGDIRFLECEAWANHDFAWFTIDDFGRRLHHPIATMPKEYRKHLRFKEHPDVELSVLDIRNSQPYFSSVISNECLIQGHLPEFIPLIKHIVVFENEPDFLVYRKLCIEGRFYEFLMQGMGLNAKDESARKKVKELFFASVLFSRARVIGENSRFREAFRKQFPSAHAMFQMIKQMDEIVLPELTDIIKPPNKKFKYAKSSDAYKLVSCMMQRAESAMMYREIAPNLIAAGIKFVTVHDSFLLLPVDVEKAQSIITDSFERLDLPVPLLM